MPKTRFFVHFGDLLLGCEQISSIAKDICKMTAHFLKMSGQKRNEPLCSKVIPCFSFLETIGIEVNISE